MTAWLPGWCRELYALLCIYLKKILCTAGLRSRLHLKTASRTVSVYSNTLSFQLFFTTFLLTIFLTVFSWVCFSNIGLANNLSIENVTLVSHDEDNDTIDINFDISWSNGWSDSTNNDAVWLFAKYCTSNCSTNGTWSHALLKTAGTNPSGFADGDKQSGSAFNTMDIVVPTDKVGAFFQPGHNTSGTVDFHDAQLVWDYAANGLDDADADASTTYIRLYGIEMTYIPGDSFYIGDGNDGSAGEFEWEASTEGPVNSGDDIEFDPAVGAADSFYYNTDGTADDDASGDAITVTSSFPTGATAFYLMKYELSQGQYRDFLNTLTQAQQDTRVASTLTNENDANTYVMLGEGTGSVSDRQAIKAGSNPSDGDPYTFSVDLNDNDTGDESGDGEWIAMNHITWMDLLAYADWAGLRPMSELEFEKACRGTDSAVINEYCWGTTNVTATTTISSSGQASEVAGQTGNGLANYNNGLTGPLRVGFAVTGSTTRETGGSGFYGNTELSGNLWERTVTVGNSDGRSFSGSSGDGELSTNGNANNSDWPGYDGSEVTGATGGGFRGSGYDETDANYLEVSNRAFAGDDDNTRRADSGGRLARTA